MLLALYWGLVQQPGAPGVRYEPSPVPVVEAMTQLAAVKPGDVVYDLGCGDGRIVIAAAKLGARAVCVDIDPLRIADAQENARGAGVAERIQFRTEDLFGVDLRDATVVMLFLSPDFNRKLRPRLQALKPGHAHRLSLARHGRLAAEEVHACGRGGATTRCSLDYDLPALNSAFEPGTRRGSARVRSSRRSTFRSRAGADSGNAVLEKAPCCARSALLRVERPVQIVSARARAGSRRKPGQVRPGQLPA